MGSLDFKQLHPLSEINNSLAVDLGKRFCYSHIHFRNKTEQNDSNGNSCELPSFSAISQLGWMGKREVECRGK